MATAPTVDGAGALPVDGTGAPLKPTPRRAGCGRPSAHAVVTVGAALAVFGLAGLCVGLYYGDYGGNGVSGSGSGSGGYTDFDPAQDGMGNGSQALDVTPTAWTHPGVLVGKEHIARMRRLVAQGNNPVATVYGYALASSFGALDGRWPLGPPSGGVIECGSGSSPDIGCSDEHADSAAAYTQMLLFAINGDARHAATAIRILNAYTRVKAYTNSNAPLQAAWSAAKWARAAELARHLPGAGWSWSDEQDFEEWLRTVPLPLIQDGSSRNGNWELSMIDACLGIAVFTEDKALFRQAAEMLKTRIKAYFYNYPADGDGPYDMGPARRDGTLSDYWFNQGVFDARTSGISQETCRDMQHPYYAVAATSYAMETAWLQGIKLYDAFKGRFTTASEYHSAFWMPGWSQPSYVCGGRSNFDIAAEELKIPSAVSPTQIVLWSHYVQRSNGRLPKTEAHLKRNVVGLAARNQVTVQLMVWELLTHGDETLVSDPDAVA